MSHEEEAGGRYAVIPVVVLERLAQERGRALLLYAWMSTLPDGTGECHVSDWQLAEVTGLDLPVIRRTIQQLQSAGLLRVLARGTRRTPTHYYVVLDPAPPSAPSALAS